MRKWALFIALLALGLPAGAAIRQQGPSNGVFVLPAAAGGGGGTGWVSVGTFLSTSTKTSSDPFISTTTAALEAGNVGVCIVAADNDGDGTDTNDFAGANSDAAGNTWVVLGENEVDPGSSQSGAVVEIVYTLATNTLASGATIAFDLAAAKPSKAASCWEFTIPVGSTLTSMGTEQKDDEINTSTVAALTVSGLANREHLFLRAWATENDTAELPTYSVGWTSFLAAGTTGSTANTNMQITGEFLITTAVSATSNPTTTIAGMDRASDMRAIDQTGP